MIREVVVVGHPGVLGMELTGACDILDLANTVAAEIGRPPAYRVTVATMGGGPVALAGGLELAGTADLARLRRPIHSLVVVGRPRAHEAAEDDAFVGVVRRLAVRSRRVGGLCTGAFILAAAGLLEGRRATTHWRFGDLLAQRHPGVAVDTDPVYAGSDGIWTSAGVTASFDLLLAFVEDDLGAEVARDVARVLVVFLRRTGNQAQFSAQLETQVADRRPVRELQQYIADHPDADLSLSALAGRLHMSPGTSDGCSASRSVRLPAATWSASASRRPGAAWRRATTRWRRWRSTPASAAPRPCGGCSSRTSPCRRPMTGAASAEPRGDPNDRRTQEGRHLHVAEHVHARRPGPAPDPRPDAGAERLHVRPHHQPITATPA